MMKVDIKQLMREMYKNNFSSDVDFVEEVPSLISLKHRAALTPQNIEWLYYWSQTSQARAGVVNLSI